MKKLIAFALAFILVITPLTVSVFAGWEEEEVGPGNSAYTIGAYTVKPVLDGKLDGDGAYTKIGYRSTEISYAWSDDVDNSEAWARGLDFQIYASYDANNIYILVVSDAKHYFNECDDGDGNAWQYSCIQVSLADDGDSGGDRLEYGLWRKSNDGGQGSVIWSQHSNAKAEFTPVAGTNYVVNLDGGKLYYETVVPVNTFLNYDSISEGDAIRFNIVIGQADANTVGHVHTQYSSGCTGNGKNSDYFAKITLGAPIVVAKLEKAEGVKLQGELIGDPEGWGGNTNAGRAAAFDGDVATYFDPATANDPSIYCGISTSEPYTLTEIRIHPRNGFLDRFEGASIWGFNGGDFDPNSATLIWESDYEAEELTWQVIPASKFLVKDKAFTHFAYYNDIKHGDVAEIELWGIPASGIPAEVAEVAPEVVDETAAGGGGDAPAPVVAAPAPAPAPAPSQAAKTGNTGIIALVAVMMAAAASVVVFKRKNAVK